MAHTQPGVAACFQVASGSSQTEKQEFCETFLSSFPVVGGIHRSYKIILSNITVKSGRKSANSFLTQILHYICFSHSKWHTGNSKNAMFLYLSFLTQWY